MERIVPIAFAAAFAAVSVQAAQWRVTALDPTHLVVQCDRTDDERAAFAMTDKERSQTGWKFDMNTTPYVNGGYYGSSFGFGNGINF